MNYRFLLVATGALALAGCGKSVTVENEAVSNITPMDANATDDSLVEIPADDGDAPSENAALPVVTNAR